MSTIFKTTGTKSSKGDDHEDEWEEIDLDDDTQPGPATLDDFQEETFKTRLELLHGKGRGQSGKRMISIYSGI